MERWSRDWDHLVLIQRARVQLPEFISGRLQIPVSPSLIDLTLLFCHCMFKHAHTHTRLSADLKQESTGKCVLYLKEIQLLMVKEDGELISQRNSSGSLKKILYHYNFIYLWTSGITTTIILARYTHWCDNSMDVVGKPTKY